MTICQPKETIPFRKDDHEGEVVVFANLDRRVGVETKYGQSDATAAHVASLRVTGKRLAQADVFDDTLLFGNLGDTVFKSIGGAADDVVAGVLARGEVPGAGLSAPWILEPCTPEQAEVVQSYLDTHCRFEGELWAFGTVEAERF